MKVLRPYTIKWKIHQLMVRAKESRMEVAIDEKALPRREGKRVSNSTLSAHIADLTKQFFPGYRFCYLTKGNLDQRYIMVMSEPDIADRSESAAHKKSPASFAADWSQLPVQHAPIIDCDSPIPIGEDYDAMMTNLSSGR